MSKLGSYPHSLTPRLEDVMNHGHEDIKICLVANKSDLESLRQVSKEEGQEFAAKHDMIYLETSARQGVNVDQAFTELAQHIFDSYKLDRKVKDIGGEEIKNMEAHGIKFGPQKPVLNILPQGSGSGADSGCC
jgi:GTPase SAR1 family protein